MKRWHYSISTQYTYIVGYNIKMHLTLDSKKEKSLVQINVIFSDNVYVYCEYSCQISHLQLPHDTTYVLLKLAWFCFNWSKFKWVFELRRFVCASWFWRKSTDIYVLRITINCNKRGKYYVFFLIYRWCRYIDYSFRENERYYWSFKIWKSPQRFGYWTGL